MQGRQRSVQKRVMQLQVLNCCFAHKIYCVFWRSRCRFLVFRLFIKLRQHKYRHNKDFKNYSSGKSFCLALLDVSFALQSLTSGNQLKTCSFKETYVQQAEVNSPTCCYWLSVVNNMGSSASWLWSLYHSLVFTYKIIQWGVMKQWIIQIYSTSLGEYEVKNLP